MRLIEDSLIAERERERERERDTKKACLYSSLLTKKHINEQEEKKERNRCA